MGRLDFTVRSAAADRWNGERVTLGLALKAQRQSLDMTLEEVAVRTHVRRAYLEALEASDWDALPSGPFAAGYAKLYAQTVGLNGAKVAAALKAEQPAGDPSLAPPSGLAFEDRRRASPALFAALGAVVAGVFLWNVAQRASTPVEDPSTPPPIEAEWLTRGAPPEVVRLAAATPPPPDQNAPAPYETPGLAAAVAAAGENAAVLAPVSLTTPTTPVAAPPQAPVGAAFNPRAAIHGAPPQVSRVTVQARRAASVVVRRSDGGILFARQLAAGEAYRAPLEAGLTVDVSEPAAFDMYRDGEFQGQLRELQTRIDSVLG